MDTRHEYTARSSAVPAQNEIDELALLFDSLKPFSGRPCNLRTSVTLPYPAPTSYDKFAHDFG
jgi:hypothetical protein